MAFYNWHFMDSYLELLIPLQDEVLAIFDAQPASLLDDLPKPSNPEELEKWELENLTLKFDRRLDLAVSYATGVPMRPIGCPHSQIQDQLHGQTWSSRMAVLQSWAMKNNRDFVFCPSCSALESIGMRRDARFMQQTSNCRYACSALKDRERDSEGRYKWGKRGNLIMVGCSCAQRMHDESH
ncbi:hypothetical protein B484DRAFT_393321 [Ochromonadaceae sp. CCMP2298]|nr:hypothetical protein B484DRAFT_393321 [Ochromonadaceae sp. CCMP2298]